MTNYVCDYESLKALRGPLTSQQVVDWINAQPNPPAYCNLSRYLLSKLGVYPRTQAGGQALAADLAANQESAP